VRTSFYIGHLKISIDSYVSKYMFGITVIPRYKQFEINVGKYALNFWWRK